MDVAPTQMKKIHDSKKKNRQVFLIITVKSLDWAPAWMKKIFNLASRETDKSALQRWLKNFFRLGSRQDERISEHKRKTDRSFFLVSEIRGLGSRQDEILVWHMKKINLFLLLQLNLDVITV